MPPSPTDGAERWSNARRTAIRIAPVVLVAVAAFVLWRFLHKQPPGEIAGSIGRWGWRRMASAVGLAFCGYGLLAANEQFALRWAGAKVRLVDGMTASFITYAFANNLGMGVLMSGALRASVYGKHGVGLTQVAKLTAYGAFTFALGAGALGGWSFLTTQDAAFTALGLDSRIGRLIGVLLALWPVAYIAACSLLRGSVDIFGRHFELPKPGYALLQLAFGLADVAVNASIIWILLGASAPRYATFLGAYLVSVVAGLLSGVPGGVGIFEVMMEALLHTKDHGASLTAALLGYRIFYYLIPLAVGAVVLFLRRFFPDHKPAEDR
jgi:uncharacterized membrane protein YbhN (UPF0104 family)